MSTARAPSSFSDSVLIQRYNAVAVFCTVRPHKPRGWNVAVPAFVLVSSPRDLYYIGQIKIHVVMRVIMTIPATVTEVKVGDERQTTKMMTVDAIQTDIEVVMANDSLTWPHKSPTVKDGQHRQSIVWQFQSWKASRIFNAFSILYCTLKTIVVMQDCQPRADWLFTPTLANYADRPLQQRCN